ncbi:hypothetical protein V1264_012405 [Littorina saxatilis]|uniref:LamG domain-containing protein n=1 Tax=Littorina saxatilis TaxID=31220 RepID=A0AAN9BX51_9CAEN
MNTFVFVILALLLQLKFGTGDPFLLSLEEHDYTPTRVWLLDSAHHTVSPNSHSLYAVLHDVHLAPGPFNDSINGSLEFRGDPSSYVEIPNTDGDLNATSVFSWVMTIKPTAVNVDGVILEYWDGTGGVRLMQAQNQLGAEAQDTNGKVYRIKTDKVALRKDRWTFLTLTFMGFNKMKFKLMYDDYDSETVDEKEDMDVVNNTVLRGTGDVRIGASRDPTLPAFSGKVACLRYYDKHIAKYREVHIYPLTCDPASGIFPLDSLSGESCL